MSLIDFFSRGLHQDWDKAYEIFDFLRKTKSLDVLTLIEERLKNIQQDFI